MKSRPYQNIIAFVAGCSGGLGRATVNRLLRSGTRVVGLDRKALDENLSNPKPLSEDESTENDLKNEQLEEILHLQNHENFVFHKGNVLSTDDVTTALSLAHDQSKQDNGCKLCVAVNCTGISYNMSIYNKNTDMPIIPEHYSEILRNNVTGMFNFTRLSAQAISKEINPKQDSMGGVIINTSGLHGLTGQMYQCAYSSSCGAINSMTLPLARDLSGCKIRVVTIAPGFFQTPLVYNPPSKMPASLDSFVGKLNAFPHRLGDPAEFAHCVTSVIENQMLNGEIVYLTAGARLPT